MFHDKTLFLSLTPLLRNGSRAPAKEDQTYWQLIMKDNQPGDDVCTFRTFFRCEASWDSSLHNSPLLNRVTPPGDTVYVTLTAFLQVTGSLWLLFTQVSNCAFLLMASCRANDDIGLRRYRPQPYRLQTILYRPQAKSISATCRYRPHHIVHRARGGD